MNTFYKFILLFISLSLISCSNENKKSPDSNTVKKDPISTVDSFTGASKQTDLYENDSTVISQSLKFDSSLSQAREPVGTDTYTNPFLAYLASLPSLKLPYHFMCVDEFSDQFVKVADSTHHTFIPSGANVIGVLEQTNDHVVIIYCYSADLILPVAEKYDLWGKRMSERKLFELGNCFSEPDYTATTSGVVTEDLQLERMIETVSGVGAEADTTIAFETFKL